MIRPNGVSLNEFERALRNIRKELQTGIEFQEKGMHVPNCSALFEGIERLESSLDKICGARDELFRRANLISKSCNYASDYKSCRRKVLKDTKKVIASIRHPQECLSESLTKVHNHLRQCSYPVFLSTDLSLIRDELQLLDRLIGEAGYSIPAVGTWIQTIQRTQRDAWDVEADGCWQISQIAQANENAPAATITAHLRKFGLNLTAIADAIDSLAIWAIEEMKKAPDCIEDSLGSPTREATATQKDQESNNFASPKKRATTREIDEKCLAALRKHHAYEDGGCLNLEAISVRDLQELARVRSTSSVHGFFDRTFSGTEQYRRLCHAGSIGIRLKLLSGDLSDLTSLPNSTVL